MKIIGIVGGIGSGKSTVAALFQQLGAAVISADKIGHRVLQNPNVKAAIRQRWGDRVFSSTGEIDRKEIAAIVFSQTNAAQSSELTFLNELTHPLIADEVDRQRQALEQSGTAICLLDAPLILESHWENLVDGLVFVDVPFETRLKRVRQRGWSKEELLRRETNQLSPEEKRSRSDYVIHNAGDLGATAKQVREIAERL
ncbi:dephospho-CoA kinase [Planctomycetales bacterium]|nr:dephospho-CoA kinase [Planctomycetales bacterium]